MSDKMDRQGAKTPADLEARYYFGKSFAEVMGVAKEMRTLVKDGDAMIDTINSATSQKIKADRIDIEGSELNIKVDATNITGEITAEQINAEGLAVKNGAFTGDLTVQHILFENKELALVPDDGGETVGVPITWHFEFVDSGSIFGKRLIAYATIEEPSTVDITDLKCGIWSYADGSGYRTYGSGTATIVAGETRSSNITYSAIGENTKYNNTTLLVATEYVSIAQSGMVFTFNGSVTPDESDNHSIGTANRRWADVYSMTGTINTSDEREKNSISEIPQKYSEMFYKLNPIIYKFNNGTSDRFHAGFSAQEVERAMTESGIDSKDFAGLIKSPGADDDFIYGLRYGEFIALAVLEIQKLNKRIEELERQINAN